MTQIPVTRTPVRVRIAPSPTGDPHVGTAYIGLFNLAFARHHGGKFVLRIEDTDQKRSTEASERAILTSLRWAGLQWDEGPDVGGPHGPYRQSERREIYREHAELLIERGAAYYCFCTPEELEQMRAAQRAAGLMPRYDGTYRDYPIEQARQRVADGEPHVVRLRMPLEGDSVVPDALRGQVRYDNRQLDDQVLLKADGHPTYHLANVVDDHLMEITHVIRAEEWINSTPKHLRLYEAFGWEPPVFVHMPLLRNPDKSKISKRKNPTSLEYYQRAGILPEAFLNFLGLLGYSMPDEREKFSLDEFASELDLARVSLGGPVFDLQKLSWLNGVYVRDMSPEALAERTFAWLNEDGRAPSVFEHIQERIADFGAFLEHARPFYQGVPEPGLNARYLLVGCGSKRKKSVRLDAKPSRDFFRDVIARLEALSAWERGGIEEALRAAVAEAGVLVGDGFMAIRVAIAGGPVAPPLFETIEVVGRAVTLVRLRAALDLLAKPDPVGDAIAAAERELEQAKAARERAEAAHAERAGGAS